MIAYVHGVKNKQQVQCIDREIVRLQRSEMNVKSKGR